MAVSYRYGLQAKVFDRMTELHSGQLPVGKSLTAEALKMLPMVVRAARALGLDKNAATIGANQWVIKLTGANVMRLLGQLHMTTEVQELVFTPTALGERLGGISAVRVNLLPEEFGRQGKIGEYWVPSISAEGLHRVLDTGKRHNDGTMVQRIKWTDRSTGLIALALANPMEFSRGRATSVEVINLRGAGHLLC